MLPNDPDRHVCKLQFRYKLHLYVPARHCFTKSLMFQRIILLQCWKKWKVLLEWGLFIEAWKSISGTLPTITEQYNHTQEKRFKITLHHIITTFSESSIKHTIGTNWSCDVVLSCTWDRVLPWMKTSRLPLNTGFRFFLITIFPLIFNIF